ncbi:MAG: lipopolysaccharide assembly protein LapA domain-containing protein [Pseudomonas sp.]|nr:lipopolysaccharide assembly protein LapA domain-containing protein [Pseudomonas sp.]
MRLLRLFVALAFVALGATVGALNRQATLVDMGFATIPATLGVALLTTLLLGVVLGGLAVTASVVLPLQRRLARLQRERVLPPTSGA